VLRAASSEVPVNDEAETVRTAHPITPSAASAAVPDQDERRAPASLTSVAYEDSDISVSGHLPQPGIARGPLAERAVEEKAVTMAGRGEGDRYQIGTSSEEINSGAAYGGRRRPPYAFSEQGIAIMRAFVRLRELLLSNADLAQKLAALESKYYEQFRVVFEAIRELMSQEESPKRRIGFKQDEDR
jgi:hypothetical protein